MSSLRCGTCGQPVLGDPIANPAFPFCSERCQMTDLSRWLNEEYSLPHAPDAEPEEEFFFESPE